jgi:hypothetical protein
VVPLIAVVTVVVVGLLVAHEANTWGRRSEISPVRRSESDPPEGRSFYDDLTKRH